MSQDIQKMLEMILNNQEMLKEQIDAMRLDIKTILVDTAKISQQIEQKK